MEKQIVIDNASMQDKKYTKKKNDDLQKKANINNIMEKYNLKAPKSKILDKKTDFQIQPKSNDQIIHIAKQQQPQQTQKPQSQQPQPQQPQQTQMQKPQQTQMQKPQQTQMQKPQQTQKPQPELNKLSIQTLIDTDTRQIEQKKLEMPKAVISNTMHPKDFMSSSNIYNIIPKINPEKQYSHLQNDKNIHKASQNLSQTPNITTKPNIYKTVSINPKLGEEASQTYKGEPNKQTQPNKQMQSNPIQQHQNPIQQHQNPIQQHQNPIQQHQNPIQQHQNPIQHQKPITQKALPQNKTIQIQKASSQSQLKRVSQTANTNANANTNNFNNNNITHISSNTFSNTFSNDKTITDLEMKRNVLKEQQRIELEKLKYKKAQILKANKQNKEMELLQSIELEKQKLHIMQNKHTEFNNIIAKQANTHTQKNINAANMNASHTPTPINLNYDTKTKKNTIVDVVDVVKNKKDIKNNTLDTDIIQSPNIKTDTKKKGIVNADPNAPYKYKSKKNAPELKWPSKTEMYDTNTFTDNLTIALCIQPVFDYNKSNKFKTQSIDATLSLEDKTQILQNTYEFKHANKFKEPIINILYNILNYDKIILLS